jgi:hypothetical protein
VVPTLGELDDGSMWLTDIGFDARSQQTTFKLLSGTGGVNKSN